MTKSLRSAEGMCKHIELSLFKIKICKLREPHHPKRCSYYHDAKKDRRRPLSFAYVADMCIYALNEKECPYGDNCKNSHNRVEEFYHPTKYKTKFCATYPNSTTCEYGDFCCFAHSEFDIKIDLIDKFEKDVDFYLFHFKTVWCPFNEINHIRDQCVYAHNWQDYRRKSNVYTYDKIQCKNWDHTKIINVYLDGCANGLSCVHSHGWKEQEYHPLSFKTTPCKHKECQKLHCPFYHGMKDKRTPVTSIFVYAPRTRVFTFARHPDQIPTISKAVYNAYPTQASPMEGLHYSPVDSPTGEASSLGLNVGRSYSPATGSPTGLNPFAPQFTRKYSYPERSANRSPPPGLDPAKKEEMVDSFTIVTQSFVKEPIFIPIQPVPRSTLSISYKTKPAPINESRDFIDELPVISKNKLQFLVLEPDEDDKQPIRFTDPLEDFLEGNGLRHLYKKFASFGITKEDMTSLTEVTLQQLGIFGEDNSKMLKAVQNIILN